MNRLTTGLLALVLACSGVSATDPLIPIRGPIVISQSGNYVVTTDFTANPGAPAIQFSNTANIVVNIDLNGHTIRASDRESILVHKLQDGRCVNLTLSNGTIHGKVTALSALGRCLSGVTINDVTLEQSYFELWDSPLTVTASRLFGSTLSTRPDFGGVRVSIVGNYLSADSGIDVIATGGQILDNSGGSIHVGANSWGSSGLLVAGNRVRILTVLPSSSSYSQGYHTVKRNYVDEYLKLRYVHHSIIEGNVIYGCSDSSNAVEIDESYLNRIDDNVFLGDCEYGIYFEDSWQNEYSGNTFRALMLMPVLDVRGSGNGSKPDIAPE